MPIAAFANLGCKVNQYETEKMAEAFARKGFDVGEFDQPADVYVINTCSVTSAADRKSRQIARRAARQKPGCRVVLTGCFAQLALDTCESVDGAALLVPNSQKMRVADLTLRAFPELLEGEPPGEAATCRLKDSIAVFPEQAGLIQIGEQSFKPTSLQHTRATLKVQDGCTHFCAFCSIPYTRSTMASRALGAVIAEARFLAEQGVREVVVTGVCVGAYKDELSGAGLPELLAALAQVDGIERVRLSSLQPIETTGALIDVIADYPAICPHLHLSLQSGDDAVLRRMQRPYDTGYYRDLVGRLRSRVPEIAITTDIIVGFPGETDDLFENTAAFAQEIAFADAHIFKYSPRERTFASREYADTISPQEKDRRHKRLTQVCGISKQEYARRLIGRTVAVIAERRGQRDGWLAGYTASYVRVNFEARRDVIGQSVQVQIVGILDGGELFGCSPHAAGC